jgi:hypothetical protein
VNFAGRDAALAASSRTQNPGGFIRAGKINAGISESFLVQNSGTSQLFGGVDAGAGGVSVVNTGSGPAAVVAYGRQTKADGTVVGNDQFPSAVSFSGQGGFVQGSAVNGCAVGSNACGSAPPPPPPPPPPPDDQPPFVVDMPSVLGPLNQATGDNGVMSPDAIDTDEAFYEEQASYEDETAAGETDNGKNDDDEEGDDSDDGSKVDPSMRLINTTPINLNQEIDDPVTSGGDVVVDNSSN